MPELATPVAFPENLADVAREELTRRAEEIERRWRYYRGRHRKPLKVRSGQPDDNVIVNLVKKATNQAVSMLFGTAPTLTVRGDEAAQEALARVWQANDAELFMHNLGLSGANAGHVFVKALPDERLGVRLVNLNARFVAALWPADDLDTNLGYVILWRSGQTEWRQDVLRTGEDSWLICEWQRLPQQRDWRLIQEFGWPYPFGPIYDWQNLPDYESYYGAPDIDEPEINDAFNLVASNINRILKIHAHPKTIGIGVRPGDLQETAIDAFWTVQNPQAQIRNLEMQSDLGSSMRYLEFLQTAFFSVHSAVDLTSMKDKVGQLTNFGLRMLFKDALDKLETKRELYGAGLVEISRRALMMLGFADPQVDIQWGDPLPWNDLEEIQSLEKELELGLISKRTAAELRARDWETEQERIAEEQEREGNLGERLLRAFERGQ